MIQLLVALGMVVVVPLGLRLIDDDEKRLDLVSQVWPYGGLVGAVSLAFDRGPAAATIAGAYAVLTLWLAGLAVARFMQRPRLTPVMVATLTAMASPLVAAVSLVAERAGVELLGFGFTTLALTVAHFHFAGFAAAVLAALAASAAPGRVASVGALAVPAGIGVVFVGYFTGDAVELAGTMIVTVGVWATAWVTWRDVRPTAATRPARILLGLSAFSVIATMLLALSWAAGQLWDAIPHLSLPRMAETHGLVNAVGFAGCGLLGWRRIQLSRGRTDGQPLAA